MSIIEAIITSLGNLIGVPEDALRLLIGILLAYPIATFYIKSRIKCLSANYQHFYFTITGILVAWWTIEKLVLFIILFAFLSHSFR